MSPEEIMARLFDIPAEELADGSGGEDVAGWDSLGHISLILEFEATYGVTLSTEDALSMRTVGDVKRILIERGAVW